MTPFTREFRPVDQWPWPLARTRVRPQFSAGYLDTLTLLDRELCRIGATHAVVCMAVAESMIRLDRSAPRADARPDHPGVMVVTDSTYGDLRYATDRFTDWQANLRAIALGLEALRKVDRYGITKAGEQYRGFAALPAPTSDEPSHMTHTDAVDLLARLSDLNPAQVRADPVTRKAAIRRARAAAHPDRHNGDETLWAQVAVAVQVVDR